jgi:hypothetical protein
MRQARKPGKLRPHAKTFRDCLRKFLTPGVWKQAQKVRLPRRHWPRWQTQRLVLVLLLMTWCCGDSAAERFETAKAVTTVCLPKRRRPGKTVQGFQKALARMPVAVLRGVATGVRQALLRLLTRHWRVHGFVPLGCDGSRVECPRTAELERYLGQAGKQHSAPTLWVTALVHVALGVPWAWRWGKGTASERSHLIQLVALLPRAALVIADAGYVGFELALTLVGAQVAFLIRVSSTVTLYTEGKLRLERFREGECLYWPLAVQQRQQHPLRVRLIRIRGRKKRGDVWLMTNVLDQRRLPWAVAAQFYRWRWESEGLFRTFKRTLAKVKLVSRTLRLVHREAEGALLATQLLLAQGAWGLRPVRGAAAAVPCSARKVLLAIRQEIYGMLRPCRRSSFRQRLAAARRERRPRRSAKVKRDWPRRRPTRPPKPPRLLTLTAKQKRLISKLNGHRT